MSESDPTISLLEASQKHVENCMRDLSGDDDFMPFMTLLSHCGELVFVGLMMPEGGEARDKVAMTMTALCVAYRATEATFASCSWLALYKDGQTPANGGVSPSQRDDRQEVVFMAAVNADGKQSTQVASVVRANNMIGTGLWEEQPIASGRFHQAMWIGLQMSKQLPPALCRYVDEELAEGREQQLVSKITNTLVKNAGSGQFTGGFDGIGVFNN